MINFKRLGNSFVYAWKGLIYALKNEQNFRIFIVLGAIVLVLMFVFDLARYERIFLLILVFSILILELVNTVFENLVDFIEPKMNEKVGVIKDMVATIVLLASITAAIIGLWIFVPHIIALF